MSRFCGAFLQQKSPAGRRGTRSFQMTLAMRAQGRTTLSGEAALRLGNLLGRQDLLGVGPAQADELLRQDLGKARDQGAFDDQAGHGGLAGLVRRADILRRVLDLLIENRAMWRNFSEYS